MRCHRARRATRSTAHSGTIDAKRAYCSVAELAGLGTVLPLLTAFTVASIHRDKMAELAAANRTRALLRLDGGRRRCRTRAGGAASGAGGAPQFVDANRGLE